MECNELLCFMVHHLLDRVFRYITEWEDIKSLRIIGLYNFLLIANASLSIYYLQSDLAMI